MRSSAWTWRGLAPSSTISATRAELRRGQWFRAYRHAAAAPRTIVRMNIFEALRVSHETPDAACHAVAEHHEMDEMVEQLEKVEASSPEWLQGAQKLCDKIEHHPGEEEHKFFQEAGKVLGEAQKLSLARDYEAQFTTLRAKEG